MATKDPSQRLLRNLLHYDPETGGMTWLERPRWLFATHNAYTSWNTKFTGKAALAARHNYGYLHGRIFHKAYLTHRVIWAWVRGEWPDQIDHINGIRDDNRIENLRSVSNAENHKNQRLRKNNKSGALGVYQVKNSNRWLAKITVDNQSMHLGYFDTFDAAAEARAAAEIDYGFHPNHGRAV